MGKKAVLIGINYPGTKSELKGCINDVKRMRSCLLKNFGFQEKDITMLIDTDQTYTQPTGKNIRAALNELVSNSEQGDELFVHYSGHGTRLPAETGDVDDTGFDECIVPSDMNLITDEDFKELVCKVHEGSRITIVSDSCHSGGLISGAKEQIGESTIIKPSLWGIVKHSVRSTFVTSSRDIDVKNRSLPVSDLIDILKEQTGNDDVDVGKIRPTLFDIFGDDASPKVKKFMKIIIEKVNAPSGKKDTGSGGTVEAVGGPAIEFLKQKLDDEEINNDEYTKPALETKVENAEEIYAGKTKSVLPSNGILLSGCQTDETSADANPTGNAKDAYGAFTNSILSILKDSNWKINNYDIVSKSRKLLKRQGFTQRPGLYCSDDYVKAPFAY